MNFELYKTTPYRSVFMSNWSEPYSGQLYEACAKKQAITFDRPLNLEFNMETEMSPDCLTHDMQMWTSDMIKGGGLPKGNGAVIISEEIWNIMQELKLPSKYNLIPIRLMFNSEVRHFYFFNIYNHIAESINFDKCIYEDFTRDRRTREIIVHKRFMGGFKSIEEEQQLLEYSEDRMKVRMIRRRVTALKKDYDILPLSIGSLRINKRAMDLFSKHIHKLIGVGLHKVIMPVTYFVCPEDYHLLDQDLDELLDKLS